MRTKYKKIKNDMLREAYFIKKIKLYVFVVGSKNTNILIFLRKYVKGLYMIWA